MKTDYRLKRLGFGDMKEADIRSTIVEKLTGEIEGFEVGTQKLPELLNLYEAIFTDNGARETKKVVKKAPIAVIKEQKKNRRKVRVNFKEDFSYAAPLLEHLYRYEGLEAHELKTGMAIKFIAGNHRINLLNYNEPCIVDGVLHANLYFNQVKTEEQVDFLDVDNAKWFRGFLVLKNLSVYEAIKILNEKNVDYLKSLNSNSVKKKKSNAGRLLTKIR